MYFVNKSLQLFRLNTEAKQKILFCFHVFNNISIPIHLHTHATTGMSNLANMRAVDAGVDNIDTSISSMSMGYGHSATETMIYLLNEKGVDLDINLADILKISEYFKKVREKLKELNHYMGLK
mgnify:CR=1 FL=1